MTRTVVRSRWLIAWDGAQQRLIDRGALVMEGDRIVWIGVDPPLGIGDEIDASDALVMPGIVNVHNHAGSFAVGRLFADALPREPRALGFLHYAAARSDARLASRGVIAEVDAEAFVRESLAHGVTTAVEYGGETGVSAEAVADAARANGLRVVVGRGFRGEDYVAVEGSVRRVPRVDGGAAALSEAIAFARACRLRDDPFVRPMLFALQADTCPPALLRAAHAAAVDLALPLTLHAAQGLFEFGEILQATGSTPIGYLADLGILDERVVLAHAAFVAGHAQVPYAADDDVARLAASGAGVVHCPSVLARRGVALESFERYRRRGIRVAIGTDTFPRDPLAEARLASYLTRVIDRDPGAGSPWSMLSALTDVAADLLQAPDVGRLAPGMAADWVAIRLDRLRHGPIYDPVATLLHTAQGDDVARVVVAGRERFVRDVDPRAVAERAWRERQQAAAEGAWEAVGEWIAQGRSAEEIASETTARRWRPPPEGIGRWR
jgi:5-methylthioadenosine/S-adenosylhomocysteine deaminase